MASNGLAHADYYAATMTVPIGSVDLAVDIMAALGDPRYAKPPRHLYLHTDVDLTFKINSTSGQEIMLTATHGFLIPADAGLEILQLYFSHMLAASGAGDATVDIFVT